MRISLNKLIGLFLFFLPFTMALTIDVGFNLKISETLLLICVLLISTKGIFFNKLNWIDVVLILFFIWSILSFFLNLYWYYDYDIKNIPYRINRIGDSFLRLIYILLCVLTFFLLKNILTRKIELLEYWIRGAFIAAIYGWYLFLSSFFDIPYLKLPGMMEEPQSLYGIIRSGTFKEGNFFGLFLLLSAAISFYRDRKKMGWFFLISILSTFSTISFLSGLLFIFVYYFSRIYTPKGLKAILILLIFFLIISPFIISSCFFQQNIKGKLFDPTNKITANNFSSVDRSLTARIAYKMGLKNPIFGTGPYNFGLHYDEYNDITSSLETINPYFSNYFKRENKRAIPNNVYMEVWSEYGIIGFLIYIIFLLKILIITYRTKERSIFAGYLALLLSMNAFPSFIMLFIWVFFAIPVAIKNNKLRVNER